MFLSLFLDEIGRSQQEVKNLYMRENVGAFVGCWSMCSEEPMWKSNRKTKMEEDCSQALAL